MSDAQGFGTVSVLVVGDAIVDRYIAGQVSRVSPEAPVPVLRFDASSDRLGGAANVAANVSSLGGQVGLLAACGNDHDGMVLRRLLVEQSVAPHLVASPDTPTTTKSRVVSRGQQMLRIDRESMLDAASARTLEQQFPPLVGRYDAVILSDYNKGALAHVSEMIGHARRMGRPVFVDPKLEDFTRYRGATALTPNLEELRRAIGAWATPDELDDRVFALLTRLSVDSLVLTRSAEGASLFTLRDRTRIDIPAEAREVFDVTGAGDTFIATFTLAVASGMDWPTSLRLANRAAGIAVGTFGTSVVSYQQLVPWIQPAQH